MKIKIKSGIDATVCDVTRVCVLEEWLQKHIPVTVVRRLDHGLSQELIKCWKCSVTVTFTVRSPSVTRTHLLLAGNDTVPISTWRGESVHTVECRIVDGCFASRKHMNVRNGGPLVRQFDDRYSDACTPASARWTNRHKQESFCQLSVYSCNVRRN